MGQTRLLGQGPRLLTALATAEATMAVKQGADAALDIERGARAIIALCHSGEHSASPAQYLRAIRETAYELLRALPETPMIGFPDSALNITGI